MSNGPMPTNDPVQDGSETIPECTGACCDPVVIAAEQYRGLSRDPRSYPNGMYIVNMLTSRGPGPSPGHIAFDCAYFDAETRRCTAYERRPRMCRSYPDQGVCDLCGGRFGAAGRSAPAGEAPSAAEHGRRALVRALISNNEAPPKGSRRSRRR